MCGVHSATDNVLGSLCHTSFVAMREPQTGRYKRGDGNSHVDSTRQEGRCACDDVVREVTLLKTEPCLIKVEADVIFRHGHRRPSVGLVLTHQDSWDPHSTPCCYEEAPDPS